MSPINTQASRLAIILLAVLLPFSLKGQQYFFPFFTGTYSELLSHARASQRPYCLFFYSDRNEEAKEMLSHSWAYFNRFISGSAIHLIDVEGNSSDRSISQELQIYQLPALIMFSPEGVVIRQTSGYLNPSELEKWLGPEFLGYTPNSDQIVARSLRYSHRSSQDLSLGNADFTYASFSSILSPYLSDLTPIRDNTSSYYLNNNLRTFRGLSPAESAHLRYLDTEEDRHWVSFEWRLVPMFTKLGPAQLQPVELNYYGILVGKYRQRATLKKEVEAFQGFWPGKLIVYEEFMNGKSLGYSLILATIDDVKKGKQYIDYIYAQYQKRTNLVSLDRFKD